MLLETGRPAEAGRMADDAVNIDPRLGSAWLLRGQVAWSEGRLDDALAQLQRALQYQRDDKRSLLLTAELYRQQGRPERALNTLETLRDGYAPGEEPQRVLYLQGLAFSAPGSDSTTRSKPTRSPCNATGQTPNFTTGWPRRISWLAGRKRRPIWSPSISWHWSQTAGQAAIYLPGSSWLSGRCGSRGGNESAALRRASDWIVRPQRPGRPGGFKSIRALSPRWSPAGLFGLTVFR